MTSTCLAIPLVMYACAVAVAVHEPRAGGHHVHRERARVADGLLDERRRRGHPVVGREGAQQDEVDVVRIEARDGDGAQGRRQAAIVAVLSPPGRPRAARGSRSAHDPLIGRVDDLLEVGVRQHVRRRVGAPAGEVCGPLMGGALRAS